MRCLELFAGAGGAALGLERAGFHHAALCEWDADACATLRAAGLGPVVEGDVRDLDAIESVAGPGPLDLLWSSFPCQAWSTAGKQLGARDDRNGWPWTVDAIDRFRPRWFLAENVRGLIQHSEDGHPNPEKCPRCYFENVILVQLRERFACVGWWLLDAADYGVPQHRRRVIIWAGPASLRAPRPTHGAPSKARQRDMFGRVVLPWVSPWWYDCPSPTVSTGGQFGGRGVFAARDRELIDKLAPDFDYSAAECATLQAFPSDHPWQGSRSSRYRQIGNAVPPPLAEVVGRSIAENAHHHGILNESSRMPMNRAL